MAKLAVLAIGGVLRLLLVVAIIAKLAFVLRNLGAVAGYSGVVAGPLVTTKVTLIFVQFPLVVVNFAALSLRFGLGRSLVLAIVPNLGAVAPDLSVFLRDRCRWTLRVGTACDGHQRES